jgi:hypothetical protein
VIERVCVRRKRLMSISSPAVRSQNTNEKRSHANPS